MENLMGHFGRFWSGAGPQEYSRWTRLVLQLGFPQLSSQTAQWEAVLWHIKFWMCNFGQFWPGTGPREYYHRIRLAALCPKMVLKSSGVDFWVCL